MARETEQEETVRPERVAGDFRCTLLKETSQALSVGAHAQRAFRKG